MIRALRKTCDRTGRFLGDTLAWQPSGRQYVVVAWGLIAGAIWLALGLAGDPGWALPAFAGCYLVVLLASVCAMDARYGIIPDSMVLALAAGGALQAYLWGPADLWSRGLEAALVFAAAALFRAGYRWLRGHDGLGFGDVKFVAAGTLWIGVEGIPGLLLIAVASALASLLILRAQGHELDRKQAISFGPHLAIGLWWIWVVGSLQGIANV
ncbi:prepilin peptidase [Bradyrhizobium jicamae]|uniref:prepilin peptidase n=1 Tax=Bradyrhizobium jicamae TaxID=280332 RepID=UPI0009F9592B|nr:A24 family peptidase [Bradyrhizobium jicamae]